MSRACTRGPSTYIDKDPNEERERDEKEGDVPVKDDSGKTEGAIQSGDEIVGSAEEKDVSQHGSNGEFEKVTSKMVVARPFVMMRGHTAFLTFATAGNLPQPDPNAKRQET